MNRRTRQVAVAAAVAQLLTCAVIASAESSTIDPVGAHTRLDAFVRKVAAKPVDASLLVVDLSDLRVVARLNPRQPMIPASNQKVFVMAAGLDLLGPEFAFETSLATDGRSLIVVGGGDPGFGDPRLVERDGRSVTTTLERWASLVKAKDLPPLEGPLVLDGSIFDEQRVHPSWSPRELQKWYAAPVGGLNINDNCIDITVIPGAKLGARPAYSVEPPAEIVRIDNRARTASKGVPVVGRIGETFTYRLSRNCSRKSTLESVAVPDGELLFASAFQHQLSEAGIAVDGVERRRIRQQDGSVPDGVQVLDVHKTSMADVLARIGKNSQNLFAECLAKRVGYEHLRNRGAKEAVGSWSSASIGVTDFLTRCGIATAGFHFADGSGLSRDNRATATQIVGVLTHMHRHSSASMFADSLAVPGDDGSLRRRMHGLANRVQAKTGTLRGVRTLAGYVDSDAGKRYAFAIFFNGIKGPSKPYKDSQDELCRLISDLDDGSTP